MNKRISSTKRKEVIIKMVYLEVYSDMVVPILDECEIKGHDTFYDSGFHYGVCINCRIIYSPYEEDFN